MMPATGVVVEQKANATGFYWVHGALKCVHWFRSAEPQKKHRFENWINSIKTHCSKQANDSIIVCFYVSEDCAVIYDCRRLHTNIY